MAMNSASPYGSSLILLVLTAIAVVLFWFQFGFWVSTAFSLVVCVVFFIARPIYGVWSLILLALTLVHLEHDFTHKLSASWQHQTHELTVCVRSPSLNYSDYQSAMVTVVSQPDWLSLRRLKITVPARLELPVLLPGDCLNGSFRLRQPVGRLVDGYFNADAFNLAMKIDAYATLVVLTAQSEQITAIEQSYRRRMSDFNDADALDIWSALSFGWSSALSSDIKDVFKQNQLMHLFVISGMHVGFVLAIAYWFVRVLLRPFSRLLYVSAMAQLGLSSVLLLLYLALLGFPVPATRAAIMALVPLFLWVGRFNVAWWLGLAYAALLVTMMSPLAWLNIGTWLSFTSVLTIALLFRWGWVSVRPSLKNLMVFQMLMSASILPWALVFGFELNLMSAVLNAVMGPLIGFVLLPMSLLILIHPNGHLVSGFEWLVEHLVLILGFTAELHTTLGWLPVEIVVLGLLLMVMGVWLRTPILLGAIWVFIAIAWLSFQTNNWKALERLTVLDVGHGQSILIETQGQRWLYDTGGMSGDQSVYERMLARKINPIDALILSHSDIDHAAGYQSVITHNPNAVAFLGQPNVHENNDHQHVFDCHVMQPNEPTTIRFLPIPRPLQTSDNNASCVVVYEVNGHRVLITGDASKRVEYYLLQTYPDLFPADVVFLGHHGSATSSAVDWLEANRDALFLVSTSDRFQPQWPANSVNQWFHDHRKHYLSTAKQGSIRVDLKPKGIRVVDKSSAYRRRLLLENATF